MDTLSVYIAVFTILVCGLALFYARLFAPSTRSGKTNNDHTHVIESSFGTGKFHEADLSDDEIVVESELERRNGHLKLVWTNLEGEGKSEILDKYPKK